MAAQNWREYFNDRFGGQTRLRVQHSDQSTRITLQANGTGTEIEVRYADNDGEIHDIQFWNSESPGWSKMVERERRIGEGFYTSERSFKPENIAGVEDWIAVPLYNGWSEEVVYVRGKHVKSRLRWKQGGRTVEITEYMEDVGWAMSIFQPIRYSDRLNRRHMQTRRVTVKPMLEPA